LGTETIAGASPSFSFPRKTCASMGSATTITSSASLTGAADAVVGGSTGGAVVTGADVLGGKVDAWVPVDAVPY